MRIAVDAMGGDFAPRAAVRGAFESAVQDGVSVLLVGDEQRLGRELARLGSIGQGRGGIEIVHAEERIEMDDPPTVVRKKRRSSLVVCADLVREGKAQAMVSAGNTGAAMVAAKLFLGALPGVDRPALAAVFPNPRGRTVVLDVGANMGWFTLLAARLAPRGRVIAVEAHPANVDLIRQSLAVPSPRSSAT